MNWKWIGTGLILLAVAGVAGCFSARVFWGAWLSGWMFWSGLGLGALVVGMTGTLTGGTWAEAARGPCVAAARTIPLFALLFIPLLLAAQAIYPWMDRTLFDRHDWPHKEIYLSWGFFAVRSVLYLLVLTVLARWLAAPHGRERRSAGGLVLFFAVMLFASTDWVMSLTPEWTSTIFPVILIIGQVLACLAFVILRFCAGNGGTDKQRHDLGNLLLAFVVFWTYVSISQLILMWSANLPREISWYLARWSGGWQYVALVLLLGQFVLPFVLLLSRDAKRSAGRLRVIAGIVLAMSAVNIFWLIKPALSPRHFSVSWLDLLVFAGLGALWIGTYLGHEKRHE